MKPPLGCIYRAVAPFSPVPPYEIYPSAGPTLTVPSTSRMVKGGQTVTVLVDVKPRPVLVITEPTERFGEVLALRLRRFSKMSETDQEAVREGEHPDLFHLRPDKCPRLAEECAAIVSTAMRLDLAALDTGTILGTVNENELRVIHERFVRLHKLDVKHLILERVQAMLAVRRKPKP